MTSRDQLQRVKDEIELSAFPLVTIDTILLRTLISDHEQMRELLRDIRKEHIREGEWIGKGEWSDTRCNFCRRIDALLGEEGLR